MSEVIKALSTVEDVLYQETSYVSSEDVPALLLVMYERLCVDVPDRILKEAEENNLGD